MPENQISKAEYKKLQRIRARTNYVLFRELYDFLNKKPRVADILRKFHDILDERRSFGSIRNAECAEESTPRPGRVKSAILGETNLNSTRVETTEGVYIVSEKIGVVEPGIPVSMGYSSSDESQDTPSYLAFGGQRYKIAR